MRLTRHVPEVAAMITLHHAPDGWRAELTHGDATQLAPLARPSAAAALRDLGLDDRADWAVILASVARRQVTATRPHL